MIKTCIYLKQGNRCTVRQGHPVVTCCPCEDYTDDNDRIPSEPLFTMPSDPTVTRLDEIKDILLRIENLLIYGQRNETRQ